MSGDPSQLPSGDHPPEPDQASNSLEDTIWFEPVKRAKPESPPENQAGSPSADQPSAPEQASISIGDTVSMQAVNPEKSETPPEKPEPEPDDRPVTFQVEPPEAMPTRRWGNLLAHDHAHLLLHVEDIEEPLRVVVGLRVVLGRVHPESGYQPDVDLTPYGARLKGVSRQHVAITFRDHMLQVEDLRSMNGTLLNGWVLIPNEPRVLRDGDQLMLGRLSLFVAVITE